MHAALTALDDAELTSRYDGAAMNAAEIYPMGNWEEDGHEYASATWPASERSTRMPP